MINRLIIFLTVAIIGFSCKTYTSNYAFLGDEENWPDSLSTFSDTSNYLIAPGDQLEVNVFANNGEVIIDPNNNFRKEFNVGSQQQTFRNYNYLVNRRGESVLPLIGTVKLEGFDLTKAQDTLKSLFDTFYHDPFVQIKVINRRVSVWNGATGQVIPLNNENMTLLEVIALSGGLNNEAKAYEIKVVRGDLKNPFIQKISVRTMQEISSKDLVIQPNDIIYIKHVRRPFNETLREAYPILSFITSTIALIAIFSNR